MTSLKGVASGVLCALAVAICGPVKAQNPNDMYGLRVCNYSGLKVQMAVSTLMSPADRRYHVFGWYVLDAGCTDIGYFARPWLYFYAEEYNRGAQYRYWPGNFPLCVDYPGPFDRVHTAGVTCDEDNLKLFTETRVEPTTGIMTINLQ